MKFDYLNKNEVTNLYQDRFQLNWPTDRSTFLERRNSLLYGERKQPHNKLKITKPMYCKK